MDSSSPNARPAVRRVVAALAAEEAVMEVVCVSGELKRRMFILKSGEARKKRRKKKRKTLGVCGWGG